MMKTQRKIDIGGLIVILGMGSLLWVTGWMAFASSEWPVPWLTSFLLSAGVVLLTSRRTKTGWMWLGFLPNEVYAGAVKRARFELEYAIDQAEKNGDEKALAELVFIDNELEGLVETYDSESN